MNYPMFKLTALSGLLLLGGCTAMPTGPSVMALPGAGKNFDQFRMDDAECRQFASIQTGGTTANQAATDATVRSAAAGVVVGAATGAAMGGQEGSGEGAGIGLLVGSMAGAGAARRSAYGTQRQYDHAYVQCMYAKGEQVPIPEIFERNPAHAPDMPPPRYYYPPPPPPGYYAPPLPPPPPGKPPY